MPAGHGLRSRTRDTFSRGFRQKGYINLTTYLRSFRLGDYVDIKVNGAVHKVGRRHCGSAAACRAGVSLRWHMTPVPGGTLEPAAGVRMETATCCSCGSQCRHDHQFSHNSGA